MKYKPQTGIVLTMYYELNTNIKYVRCTLFCCSQHQQTFNKLIVINVTLSSKDYAECKKI